MSIRIEVYEFVDPAPGNQGGGGQLPSQPSYVPAHPDYSGRAEYDYGDGYADAAAVQTALIAFNNYRVDYAKALELAVKSPTLDCVYQKLENFSMQAIPANSLPENEPYLSVFPSVLEAREHLHIEEPSQDDLLRKLILSAARTIAGYLKYNICGLPITQTVITGATGLVNLNAFFQPNPQTAIITYGSHAPAKVLATKADATVSVTQAFRMIGGIIQLLPYTLFQVTTQHAFWNPTAQTVHADQAIHPITFREAINRLLSYWFDATGEPLEEQSSQSRAIYRSGAGDLIAPYRLMRV